ncbi:D-amino-acid oxidase [Cyphellophora attinorum]|uniref:D-amino-acid oxidase n=1 Tax=Cyphellophora attinorum TaxID=1664694 RepID=A0A0N0NP04_9EURO|nr:D-amino-acid oxidase [Phialophora attinorum]KPI41989.1 D-amino-acid oxidase [Phialophora attinorum]
MVRGERQDVGVVGAGIVGLTCALRLSEAGYRVTVLARDLPGDLTTAWASPWAGAVVLPFITKDSRDRAMQIASLRYYWSLAHRDPTCGVQTVTVQEYWDHPSHDESDEWYATAVPHFRRLNPDELPPGTKKGNTFVAISVNPERYLQWLAELLETSHKVRFIRANVNSLKDAKTTIECKILVNASGLGAKELAKDPKVIGVRGQTMFVDCPRDPKDASKVIDKEVRIRRGTEYTYVLPRMLSGGVIIGGVEEEGSTNTDINVDLQRDIIERVNTMTNGWFRDLKLSDVRKNIAGVRPGREGGYRIEKADDAIHAYGFGGAGYRYSIGAADIVVDLVQKLQELLARL